MQKILGSQLSSWNTQLTSLCIAQGHPNSIQLVLCVVEEVWGRVASTGNVKEWKGKA